MLFRSGAPTTWTPAATLVESEDALTLHVQLPGVNAEEIEIGRASCRERV